MPCRTFFGRLDTLMAAQQYSDDVPSTQQDPTDIYTYQATRRAIEAMKRTMQNSSFVYAGDRLVLERAVETEFTFVRQFASSPQELESRKNAFLDRVRQIFTTQLADEQGVRHAA